MVPSQPVLLRSSECFARTTTTSSNNKEAKEVSAVKNEQIMSYHQPARVVWLRSNSPAGNKSLFPRQPFCVLQPVPACLFAFDTGVNAERCTTR